MIIDSFKAEKDAIICTAQRMAAAARTAPKACGKDYIKTMILTDEDLLKLADTLELLGKRNNTPFFIRDANCLRQSTAIVIIATGYQTRGLGNICGLCRNENCSECIKNSGVCIYDQIDLGIAIGSAVSVASAAHIDNRIMFSAGVAVKEMGLVEKDTVVMTIPLSASGKSVFFDRK